MKRLAVAAVGWVFVSGCVSLGSVQTASTLGKGNFQGGVEIAGAAAAYTSSAAGVNGTVGYPTVNFSFRFGITDSIDIGVRAGSTLLELQTKFLLNDPENPNFAISLAPALSGYGFGLSGVGYGVVNLPIPLLIGLKLGSHELVFGPRILNTVVFGSGSGATAGGYGLSAGVSIGFAARLGDVFILMPEAAVGVPIFTTVAASAGGQSTSLSQATPGVVQFSFTLGGIFGKLKPVGGAQQERRAPPLIEAPPPSPPPADGVVVPPPPPPPPPPPSSS